MQEENFSPQDSIKLIQGMIAKTRADMGDNASYFILWGWITFLACTGQFVLKNLFDYSGHYQVWLLVIPGVFITIYLGNRQKKARTVHTYIGESMKYLWTGMGISFFVLSMIFTRMGWGVNIFPFFIMLYGLGTFISGKLLQFNPLVIGGLIAFALAIISTYFNYDYQMLFGAAAILFSYLIPAYLLRRKNRSLKIA